VEDGGGFVDAEDCKPCFFLEPPLDDNRASLGVHDSSYVDAGGWEVGTGTVFEESFGIEVA
jgi:hypothetical protein